MTDDQSVDDLDLAPRLIKQVDSLIKRFTKASLALQYISSKPEWQDLGPSEYAAQALRDIHDE